MFSDARPTMSPLWSMTQARALPVPTSMPICWKTLGSAVGYAPPGPHVVIHMRIEFIVRVC